MKRKVLTLGIALVILFGVFGLAACSNGKTIEVDGWTLYRFNGNYGTERGRVNIVRANDESLVVDGVLNIPAKIGKYNIHGFGSPNQLYGSGGANFGINNDACANLERIVIAEELYVNRSFFASFQWMFGDGSSMYVEFLSDTFERVDSLSGSGGVTVIFIIPDGSTQNFIDRNPSYLSYPERYIEKSKYLEEKNID